MDYEDNKSEVNCRLFLNLFSKPLGKSYDLAHQISKQEIWTLPKQ